MIYNEFLLDLPYEKAGVAHSDYQAKLVTYFQNFSEDIYTSASRPAVIICPGGAYAFTSDREAEPIAMKFTAMGYHACVLRYSVAPDSFPSAQMELAESIHMLRTHAEEWHIDPNQILVLGFSAGGHLAASLSCLWNQPVIYEPLGLTAEDIRPNGSILCYPVITSGDYAHHLSIQNLAGAKYEELKDYLSLENRVGEQVPPTFIWTTVTDELVPVENTIFYINALQKAKVPFEAHLYPTGIHGLSLADVSTNRDQSQQLDYIQNWICHAEKWIRLNFPLKELDA